MTKKETGSIVKSKIYLIIKENVIFFLINKRLNNSLIKNKIGVII